MRRLIATALGIVLSVPAYAGPQCTSEPESTWLTEAQLRDRIQPMELEIVVLKKTSGNCFEIYGREKSGKRVEIYFHPITAEVMKSTHD